MQRIRNFISRILFRENNKTVAPPDIINDLKRLCNGEAQVVFDIGAHHGGYANKINNAIIIDQCYCFEPFAPSYDILEKQLAGKQFQTFPIALSNFEGYSDFYSNQFEQTNSLLPSVTTNSSIDPLIAIEKMVKVKVETLDNFCDRNGIAQIDILKIDTQGNTFNVLNGGKRLLQTNSIKLIQCEVEFIEIYKDEPLYHKIADFLERYGYRLYSIYDLHFDINNRLSWGDALFVKHDYKDKEQNS